MVTLVRLLVSVLSFALAVYIAVAFFAALAVGLIVVLPVYGAVMLFVWMFGRGEAIPVTGKENGREY